MSQTCWFWMLQIWPTRETEPVNRQSTAREVCLVQQAVTLIKSLHLPKSQQRCPWLAQPAMLHASHQSCSLSLGDVNRCTWSFCAHNLQAHACSGPVRVYLRSTGRLLTCFHTGMLLQVCVLACVHCYKHAHSIHASKQTWCNPQMTWAEYAWRSDASALCSP